MGILDNIQQKTVGGPPKGIIYGPPGVGKTTFAVAAPSHIIIDTENGANHLECSKTPYLRTYNEIIEYLDALIGEPHKYKVVCIDTIDWLVQAIDRDIIFSDTSGAPCSLNRVHGGYGAGKEMRKQRILNEILPRFDTLVSGGIAVILLAHTSRVKVTSAEGYDIMMTAPNLPPDMIDLFVEWSDFVGYASKKEYERELQCVGTSDIVAKNRYHFPERMKFDWGEFSDRVRKHMKSMRKGDGQ